MREIQHIRAKNKNCGEVALTVFDKKQEEKAEPVHIFLCIVTRIHGLERIY